MPTVWVLYSEGPHTFSALHRRLGASRDTLTDTLANLVENGIVQRPSAPRQPYSLTPAGAVVGIACGGCVEAVRRTETREVALKKWPFLVLTAMGYGATRYNQLLAALPGVTPRALAHALRDLEEAGLVTREVLPWRPPITAYSPTEKGNAMLPELDALARACDDAMAVITP